MRNNFGAAHELHWLKRIWVQNFRCKKMLDP